MTAVSSIVRSAAGKLELDELQSSREAMNAEITNNLFSAA
jgi:regulator of protease activity HflC (stomatin/prohibitin superfamily)